MEVMNNFIGFAEEDNQRTDGIYGLFRSDDAQEEESDQSDQYDEEDGYNYEHRKSNEDLFDILEPDEQAQNFDLQDFLGQQARKKVSFAHDQLEFKTDDIPPLINEQPDPVIMTNYKPRKSKSRSASAKGRPKSAKKPNLFQQAIRKKRQNKAKQAVFNSLKGKAYKVKNKPKKNFVQNKGWNDNTNTVGFFDSKLAKQRKLFDEPSTKSHSQKSGLKVMQENPSAGKFFVDFMNNKGQKTGSLKMNKDLLSIQEEAENREFQNLKSLTGMLLNKSRSSKSKGGSKSRSQSRPRQKSVSRLERETNTGLGAVYGGRSVDRKRDDDNRAIQKKINDNFVEKESLIKMLTQELNVEKERRKVLDKAFKQQVGQFENELKKIKNTAESSRKRANINQDLNQESLDMIPTKEKPISKSKAHNIKRHKPTPYKSAFGKPRLNKTSNKYKNVPSKIKSSMSIPETYKKYKQQQLEKSQKSYTDAQVHSIEQTLEQNMIRQNDANLVGSGSPAKPVVKPLLEKMNSKSSITKEPKAESKKKSSLANIAMTMMHKQEIERQMQLDMEKDMAIEILGKFKQNPNFEMHKVQMDLERINQKLDPIMDKVDQQLHNVGITKRFKDQANAVGLVSKIAGRYISFYSDELAEMLLDDILEDTVFEMQKIEQQVEKTYVNDQQQLMAQEIMNMLIDYENDAATVVTRAEQMLSQIPAKKEVKRQPMGIKETKGVKFEIDEDAVMDVYGSQKLKPKSAYVNPFTSAIDKAVDYEDYEDDFEEESKDKHPSIKSKGQKPAGKKLKSYKPSFEESLEELIKFEGKNGSEQERVYKWRAKVPTYMKENIEKYQKEFEKFLVVHNNTSNQEIWKIYDHITDDIFNEVYEEAVKDLENIEEYCIQTEFFG